MKYKATCLHAASLVGSLCFMILAVGSVDDSSSSSSGGRTNAGQGSSTPIGTLHKATVGQWKLATHENKMATALDFLAATKWKGHLNSNSDLVKIQIKARMLVTAVDDVVTVEGTDSMEVAEIAGAIILTSTDLGP